MTDEAKEKIYKSKKGVPNTSLAKPVIRILPNGKTIEYDSVAYAKRKGFCGVDRVCMGERPTAYKCKWFYKEDYEKILGEKNS